MNEFAAWRKAKELSQDEAAAILKVDRTTVSKWETGKALPRPDLFPKIIETYKITSDEIISVITSRNQNQSVKAG